MQKISFVTLVLFFLFSFTATAQRTKADVIVDKDGVLRWGTSKEEVRAFGINYTVPFAHAYRTAKNMGIDIEKAIDQDVYHFARLGFDLYRVHVWDTEISDTLGNLLPTENLRLFDYMVMKMKERGMKFIITPIAYWGNGWPEPDEPTPGFSRKYGKDACLTNPDAIKAQERYLFQFLNHVNSYTGIPYKNDPDIIAFEVSNEPHHREAPEKVTTFINRMVKAMRNTGCKKPILYNITHSIHLSDAYFKSTMQGGTFQWYPTGLGARHELGGNLLPNVDRYVIPFANHPKFKSMAKIVYEFDAADVGRSYIYPAMARSFREAGMQVATHFSYDPTYMAYANTEYGTHYMNLAYTPQKALSLMISSEVFHRIPMNKSFGRYPDNTSFDAFRVDYEDDLAEMITEKKFIYTNTTSSQVHAPEKLEQLAGSGNSTLVQYEGTGAYFLDRIGDGVWRLEVMPDAIWIKDPFERTSLKKEIAVINWRTWPITIQLPNLGLNYAVLGLNTDNIYSGRADGQTVQVKPGTYLLTREGVTSGVDRNSKWKNIFLSEFVAPQASVNKIHVLHKPVVELTSGSEYHVSATIVSKEQPENVELHVWGGFRPMVIKMVKQHGYAYSATIPAERTQPGFLRYFISVKEQGKFYTYPAGAQTYPGDWDFYAIESYTVPVVERTSPLYLFNAQTDSDQLIRQWVRGSSIIPTDGPGKAEVLVNIEQLFREDPEQKDKEKIYDYSMRYFFGRKVEGRKKVMGSFTKVVFTGRSLNDKPCTVQLALLAKNGSAYAHSLVVTPEKGEFSISMADFRSIKPVTLPRPYPTFLPYYFEASSVSDFSIEDMESLQISIGPGIPEHQLQQKHGIAIESIRLER